MNKKIVIITVEVDDFLDVDITIQRAIKDGFGYWEHHYEITNDQPKAQRCLARVQNMQKLLLQRTEALTFTWPMANQ